MKHTKYVDELVLIPFDSAVDEGMQEGNLLGVHTRTGRVLFVLGAQSSPPGRQDGAVQMQRPAERHLVALEVVGSHLLHREHKTRVALRGGQKVHVNEGT